MHTLQVSDTAPRNLIRIVTVFMVNVVCELLTFDMVDVNAVNATDLPDSVLIWRIAG